jgi:hypothetical protein
MSDATKWVGEMSAEKLDLLIRKIRQKKEGAEGAQSAPRIARRERPEEPAPLSFGQQQLWFMEQMSPGSAVYNLPAAVRCEGDLRIDVLERCLAEIERRHEALRTRFPVVDGRPVQVIVPPRDWNLAVRDLTDLPETEREREADHLAAEEARRPFDLASGRPCAAPSRPPPHPAPPGVRRLVGGPADRRDRAALRGVRRRPAVSSA